MSNPTIMPKCPELKLTGNISENFKNFEIRFNDYCIQAGFRDLDKDPTDPAELDAHYSKPILELSALRSALPDASLQVIRYTIEPQMTEADRKKPYKLIARLRDHYQGGDYGSVMVDRYRFWNMTQSSTESTQDWEVRVRQSAALCQYGAANDELSRDKFVFGLTENTIRTELLKYHKKPDGSLKKLADVALEARAMESAIATNKLICDTSLTGKASGSTEEQVHFTKSTTRRMAHKDMKLRREHGTCHWCGDRRGPHPWASCPAKGRTCTKCGRDDHFARVCLMDPLPNFKGKSYKADGKRTRQGLHELSIAEPDSHGNHDDDMVDLCYGLEQVHHTTSIHPKPGKRYFTTLHLSLRGDTFTELQYQLDSASTCNTISDTWLKKLGATKIQRSSCMLFPYGQSTPIKPLGHVSLLCDVNGKYETLKFQVLSSKIMGKKPALLCGEDAERLGLMKFHPKVEVFAISAQTQDVQTPSVTTSQARKPVPLPSRPIHIPANRKLPPPGQLQKEDILATYKGCFSGIGKLGPPVHFSVDTSVSPVQMPIHRVPLAKREKEKITIQRYVEMGILAKVEEPTAWVSNETIRETPKKFRICIDPSQTVNKAIQRPLFQMPTLTEQLHKLSHAKCFSLLDVREGFLHVPLDEKSSYMTTMHTSYGRYRWLRLPFGVNSAPEEFQSRLASALEGLSGIANIADDILLYGEGNTYEEAVADHDRRLVALMERCAQRNIRLNPDKFRFKLRRVPFMGNVVTDKGLQPDPDKVSAIVQMPSPKTKADVLRLIGMVNYLSPFCPNASTVIQPLRTLTHDGAEFLWAEPQQEAFRKIKELIANAPTLLYYDLTKPVVLQVDASDFGLGGALLQANAEGKLQPVAFTSCSLSPTERNYSQIEKECLAICNGLQKFDTWLYGKSDIEVHSDHQPLETIFRKPLNRAPARLQRMMMRLQRYSFKVIYKRGTSLHIADTLSRAALPDPVVTDVTGFNVFRLSLEQDFDLPNPRLLSNTEDKLRTAIQADQVMQDLVQIIMKGWPADKRQITTPLHPYWPFRDELSILNGLIYKGQQVLVPPSMYSCMLQRIHLNHSGTDSNMRMAREVLFWPGMKGAIKDLCSTCERCASFGKTGLKEPMRSLPVPSRPWQLISQDIFQHDGRHYLVTVCHFSDWIECDELQDTLSSSVVDVSKWHFARYGKPEVCHTDNGPQFTSKEYRSFASSWDFCHTTSSPYHSQGNGKAEAAVKICKDYLRKGSDLAKSLLNYRNTPQQGHAYSPALRLQGRRLHSLLPVKPELLKPQSIDSDAVVNDIHAKRLSAKQYYDKHVGQSQPALPVGTKVFAKPPPQNRGSPWTPGVVVSHTSDRSYTIQTPSHTIRRNRIHVRPAPPVESIPHPHTITPQAVTDSKLHDDAPRDSVVDIDPVTDESSPTSSTPPTAKSTVTNSKISEQTTPLTTRSGRLVKPRNILDL